MALRNAPELALFQHAYPKHGLVAAVLRPEGGLSAMLVEALRYGDGEVVAS